jgi:hypothetical protein
MMMPNSVMRMRITGQNSGSSGKKAELRVDENGVPIDVIEKRRLDAAMAKEYRGKIKASLEKRPTLIDRHYQVSQISCLLCCFCEVSLFSSKLLSKMRGLLD